MGLYKFKEFPFQKRNAFIPYWTSNHADNSFGRTLYDQVFVNPLPFLLHQYDRASMANGVECRMPFLDYRVVEYIFSLPLQSKLGGGYTKKVLRESVKGLLPDETRLNKLKTGFNAPTIEWFKSDLRDWFCDQISSQSFLENPYFDGKKIKQEFSSTIDTGDAWKYTWKYWSHIHLSWWYKNFTSGNESYQ